MHSLSKRRNVPTHFITWVPLLVVSALAISVCGCRNRDIDPLIAQIRAMHINDEDPNHMDTKTHANAQKRADLIMKVYRLAPDDPRVPDMLVERWDHFPTDPVSRKDYWEMLNVDIDIVQRQSQSPGIREVAAFYRAVAEIYGGYRRARPSGEVIAAADGFIREYPRSPYASRILYEAATQCRPPDDVQLLQRLVKVYPDFDQVGSPRTRLGQVDVDIIRGRLHLLSAVATVPTLHFTDALSGRTIDLKDLHGRVILIEFWSTWCMPCRGQIPYLKQLYAANRRSGLEIVGVVVDSGDGDPNPATLKSFCAHNGINWPQYRQGAANPFSTYWGCHSIPSTLLLDRHGAIAYVSPPNVEEMINRLLATQEPSH